MEYPIHARDIGTSDPHILADKVTGKYYMTSSGFTLPGIDRSVRRMGTIVCLVSEDLIHWSEPVTIFDCNGTDYWGKSGYPATEMHCFNGKYYLSGTAGEGLEARKSMILVADNPLGPYTWIKNERYSPPGWQTIDTTLYMDKNGHPWFVFSHEWMQVCDGQFVAQPLSDDFSETIGGPMILLRASEPAWSDDLVWTTSDAAVTDGCWFHRMEDGTLLMLWTTRSRTGYTLGYSKSTSGEIWGPWEHCERPLYAHDGGHCNLFRRLSDNQLMMSMHVADRGPKMFCLFEMEERNGELNIVNEVFGNWYHTLGGNALPYKKDIVCDDEYAFTKLMPSGYEGLKLIQSYKAPAPKPKKASAKKIEEIKPAEEAPKKADA